MFIKMSSIKKSLLNIRGLTLAAAAAVLIASLSSCATNVTAADDTSDIDSYSYSQSAVDTAVMQAEYDEADTLTEWSEDADGSTVITLSGEEDVQIGAAGTYILRGSLNGSVIVEAADSDVVRLILDGAEISCKDSAPINIKSADKVYITLADGSVNTLTDGESYIYADGEDEPSAALFSKCDLTINGGGTLTVTANFNNGIQSKDDLKITGGTINVVSSNDGIKGKDSLTVKDADITVTAGGDGLRSNNSEDSTRGYIIIESGTIDITAAYDGIQAETALTVFGGTLNITTGGGSVNAAAKTNDMGGMWGQRGGGNMRDYMPTAVITDSETISDSAKGLKAETTLQILGGDITVDSSDDALHCGFDMLISDGSITLLSGDDGIHADSTVQIDGGNVTIAKSYEGIEGAEITINGGIINITASDDGFNAANGSDTGFGGGFNDVQDANIYFNGGAVNVNASGDGIDSNGNIYMTGGEIYVSGPSDSGNGAMDYAGSFEISGGNIIAVGASGMAQGATGGEQCSAVVTVSNQNGGSELSVTDSDENVIVAFIPARAYNSVFVSSPAMKVGENYIISAGGVEAGSFDQSSTVISSGGMGGFGDMGGGFGDMGGGFRGNKRSF